jgi:hypothetical protein
LLASWVLGGLQGHIAFCRHICDFALHLFFFFFVSVATVNLDRI